jgi:hypothetical protein
MATPWKTTNELVDMIKRKIALPIYQTTFTQQDVIDFLNEEMMISQVPRILQYHEEYFVYRVDVQLQSNVNRYAIPDRAIGMRLRDIKFVDSNGNLFDMSQIPADDKAFFQRAVGANEAVHKFYIEGNDVRLTPAIVTAPSGSLAMFFYIRPNQLVTNDRAAITSAMTKTITISNNSAIQPEASAIQVNGIVYSPVISSPAENQFVIGIDATATGTNLANAINTSSLGSYITASSNAGVVTLSSSSLPMYWNITNTPACYTFTNTHTLVCTTAIPSNITGTTLVDLLQTKPGHRIHSYDIDPVLVSGNTIVINDTDMPTTFVTGDYVCAQNECIIPYLPPDLHNGLAEMASSRILAAQGDAAGLQMAQQKIDEIDKQTNRIIADRAESTPLKLNARGSIMRYTKMGTRRRL